MRAVATLLLACLAGLALGACTMVRPSALPPADYPLAQPVDAAPVEAGQDLALGAVVRQGQGGYQRTTVPPGFLVLMLAVPLVILVL